MANTFLSSDLVRNLILPFLLVFAVLFAILEKSKILGEDKRQINAIVSMVLALVTVTFAQAVDIINSLIPFLAVAVVIILVFLLLVAFVGTKEKEFKLESWQRISLTVVIIIAVIIAVLFATGAWDPIYNYVMSGATNSTMLTNVLFAIVIIAAVIIVLSTKKSGSST